MPAELALYASVLMVIVGAYVAVRRRQEAAARRRLAEAQAAGLTAPASLHPVIDEALCLGCRSCVKACPEGDVLGLVGGKARLVNPSGCIGHGACRTACPLDAIRLVFGTAERGVDIPHVGPDFQTNVPGIYIAGELGGMGLIRNAVEQGRQAVDAIAARLQGSADGTDAAMLDLVIVGAGPSGISASLGAMQHGLRSVTLEQDTLGGTVAHFPRGKVVMTAPVELPLAGRMRFNETSKEELLAFWQGIIERFSPPIHYSERVQAVNAVDGGFEVCTAARTYRTRTVLLAIGRRGTPRKLGVPGEEQRKVVYRLDDPAQYAGRRVLVVGGGDSALEAATTLAEEEGTEVTLSYRSGGFSRAKPKNRAKVERAVETGRLRVLLKSNVVRIDGDRVELEQEGRTIELANDAVIVCAGGILPTPFLKEIGIAIETKYGTE